MLQKALSQLLDVQIEIADQHPLSGGCISEVSVVTMTSADTSRPLPLVRNRGDGDPATVVVKRNSAAMEENFRCEAAGLRAIHDAGAIRVPIVHATGRIGDHAYLVIEWIRSTADRPGQNLFERFGRELAELHKVTAGRQVGWQCNNFLGSAPQLNPSGVSWPAFFAEYRIGFQIKWASDQGLATESLKSDCELIAKQMDDLLAGRDDSTSLIHGDLWSGNYLFDDQQQPVLLDPAVYRGCREAEWGMITWFGSCPREFAAAYQEHWPMPEGWRRRVAIYRLYHQLNHLNLFGRAYAAECQNTAAMILRD